MVHVEIVQALQHKKGVYRQKKKTNVSSNIRTVSTTIITRVPITDI